MLSDTTEPTGVCERLDVVCQVNVHTFCILHFFEDDPNEPHGHKVIPVSETQNSKWKLVTVADYSN